MSALMWWIAGAIVVGVVEVMTGTFYFLVVSGAMTIGAVANYANLSTEWQFGLAGVSGFVGVLWLRSIRLKSASKDGLSDPDIGQRVEMDPSSTVATVRVKYRGTTWDAELSGPDVDVGRTLKISGKRGSVLIVSN